MLGVGRGGGRFLSVAVPGLVCFLGEGVGAAEWVVQTGTPARRTLDPELRRLPVGTEMLTWPSLPLAWALESPPRPPSPIWKAERGVGKLRVVPSALPPTRRCSLGPLLGSSSWGTQPFSPPARRRGVVAGWAGGLCPCLVRSGNTEGLHLPEHGAQGTLPTRPAVPGRPLPAR